MSKDDGRYDGEEKVIDITDYVNRNTSFEEKEMKEFTNRFVSMVNQNLIERQKREARERFIHFMLNFLLFTQMIVVVAICFLIIKLYS